MFQFGDQQPYPRIRVLYAAVLAIFLCACGQGTATSPEITARAAGVRSDTDMPEVVITASRHKPLRLAAKAGPKSGTDAK